MKSSIYLAIVVLISFADRVRAEEKIFPSSILVPSAFSNNKRFSRVLHDNAASLQFSSISNLSPPISGLSKKLLESRKINDNEQKKTSLTISSTNLGRRTLDYDDSEIITNPQPGNEYVYIRQGGIQSNEQQAAEASVTSINRQPTSHRVPLTLLRQSNGKTVNINPVFPETSSGVHVPLFYQNMLNGKSDIVKEEDTTVQDNEDVEVTTIPTVTQEEEAGQKMVVNVITSPPREFESVKNDTVSTTPAVSKVNAIITTPTTTTPTTTTTTSTEKPTEDLKENLVVQSSRRIGSFPDFEDNPTRLQTSETNTQPARVNVRPASSGKEYEYEYIYYYYDDDEENNGTVKTNGTGKHSTQTRVNPEQADFEDDEEVHSAAAPVSKVSIPTKATTTTTTTTTTLRSTTLGHVPQRVSPLDKFSTGVVNDIHSQRTPKAFQTEKVSTPNLEYKIEAEPEYEYVEEEEDEEVLDKAKGQPQHGPSDDEPIAYSPSTAAPVQDSSSGLTMPKTHPDSVNTPIVLKQSNLLQAVPASRLQPQQEQVTTPTTSTTSEAPRQSNSPATRFRGGQRTRGEVKPETETPAAIEQTETAVRPRPNFTRGRIPSRRPVETSQSEVEEVSSSARPNNVRSRFPSRSTTTTTTTTTTSTTTIAPVQIHSQIGDEDSQAKENFVRNKSVNDLFTFTRLQQAIGSRSPSRSPVFQSASVSSSSSEQSTESGASSEATTFASVSDTKQEEPSAPTTTTTTTTLKSVSVDKFGKQRHRFGAGRVRASTPSDINSSTTEVPARVQTRGRFNRRKPTTTVPEASGSDDGTSQTSESDKPRVQTRNRFNSRTRSTTESSVVVSGNEKTTETLDSHVPTATSTAARRRPIFQNRRRPNQGSTSSSSPTEEAESSSPNSDISPSPSSPTVSESSATPESERRRPGLPNGQRRRPQVGGQRIRGGRLGASTSTTVATPDKENAEQTVSEQTVVSINEQQVEGSPIPSSTPVETTPNRGNTGVIGRLRTKPRLPVTTTTAAPESIVKERKPSRLNGILGRRKPGVVQVTTPKAEESQVNNEESNNNAQEQDDSPHKGVVVQVSSSVTESEEVHQGGEELEPSSSSTPASILNRLKSQRKPGSIFKKRTDPHGE